MQNLKPCFTVATALLLSLNATAQPPEPRKDPPPVVEAPQIVEPQQVINAFVDAVGDHLDLAAATLFVEGGQTGTALQPVATELQKERGGWKVRVLHSDAQVKGDTVTMKLVLQLHHHLFGKIIHQERLTLHKVGDAWKIVPLSADEFYHSRGDSFDSDVLANMATYLARPQEIQEASAYACLSNLKQLGLGAMQFLQDYDLKFALKAATYQQALLPYTRSEQLFHCPEDKSGAISYSFNVKLENFPAANIADAAQTVMIYEGKDGQLEFRHNNRAGVCFADGHCQLVTPEAAKTLRWQP